MKILFIIILIVVFSSAASVSLNNQQNRLIRETEDAEENIISFINLNKLMNEFIKYEKHDDTIGNYYSLCIIIIIIISFVKKFIGNFFKLCFEAIFKNKTNDNNIIIV